MHLSPVQAQAPSTAKSGSAHQPTQPVAILDPSMWEATASQPEVRHLRQHSVPAVLHVLFSVCRLARGLLFSVCHLARGLPHVAIQCACCSVWVWVGVYVCARAYVCMCAPSNPRLVPCICTEYLFCSSLHRALCKRTPECVRTVWGPLQPKSSSLPTR